MSSIERINAAAEFLKTSNVSTESAPMPTETGMAGAVAAMTGPDDAGSKDESVTRVAEDAQTPVGEAEAKDDDKGDPKAETKPEPKQEPEKPKEKVETEAQKLSKQFHAMERIKSNLEKREKALQVGETRVNELIRQKEQEYEGREKRLAELEKFEEKIKGMKPLDLVRYASELKGTSHLDVIRMALAEVAGHPTEEAKKEPEAELDPRIVKLIKEQEAKIEAAERKAEEARQLLEQEKLQSIAREDNEIIESVKMHALSLINEEKFPYLAAEDRDVIAQLYLDTANEQVRLTGQLPPPEAILEHLDVLHEQAFHQRYERLQPRLKPVTSAPLDHKSNAPVEETRPSQVSEAPQNLEKRPNAIPQRMAQPATGPSPVVSARRRERELVNEAAELLKNKGW